jgi:hypothetical protein
MLAIIGGPTFLDDRVTRVSGASDSLYTDDAIVAQLNEAQRILCDEAWVLEDTTTAAACEIQLVQDVTDYPLHDSVLGIKYVRLSDSDVDLLRVGYYDNRLHNLRPLNEPDFWDVNTPLTETSGRPTRWSSDIGTATIRLRRKPDATAAALKAKLSVVRLPIVDLATGSPGAAPEVKPKYHMLLCKYAAGQLGSSGDVDSGLPQRAARWLREWDAGLKTARRSRQRLQQSQPQWRYGGWGRGGMNGRG